MHRRASVDRRLIFPVVLCLVAGMGGGLSFGEESGVFPYPTHVETLDNGLRVILIPMRSDGLVAYWSIVRTGSRDEYEPGHSGFAHFFEHMMFRGTAKYPAARYNAIVTEMGADANAYTTDDLTAYHLGITAADLEQAFDLESDRFRTLAYSEEDFRTEAGAVYGEYRKNRMNPFFTIYEAAQATAFTRHTYGHTTMGYERDIQAMPGMYDYSRTFFARYYRPDNVVLLIVGDIEVPTTLELARRYYGGWQRGYQPPQIPGEPEQQGERTVEVAYAGRSLPLLRVSYRAGAFDPADRTYVAAGMLAQLAFGPTSEIYKKLVLEQQSVELIQAALQPNRDPGLLSITTRVKDPARVQAVLAEIDATVAACRDTPPPVERLAALKSRMRYEFLMGLDTPDRVASGLARYIALTGGVEVVETLFRTLQAVTPQDVQDAARAYLVQERRTVARLQGAN